MRVLKKFSFSQLLLLFLALSWGFRLNGPHFDNILLVVGIDLRLWHPYVDKVSVIRGAKAASM